MTGTLNDTLVFETADALARAIRASAAWRDFLNARQAAETDAGLAQMFARQRELSEFQNSVQGRGQGLDGESLVEFIVLRDQLQHHKLTVRQQEAGSAVAQLLQQINEKISGELGFDFASSASPQPPRVAASILPRRHWRRWRA